MLNWNVLFERGSLRMKAVEVIHEISSVKLKLIFSRKLAFFKNLPNREKVIEELAGLTHKS